ncbi:PalH-domain-containing protein [Tothia fuscella]|uniref:PalH-domain-containing protein n=1 Tax=Tothia fuscella TaxID=1048955 RepID=A0A9P4TYC0_9PEZI|nr:PalH-domain-containing protein [Tothia fuscella]
MAGNGGAAAATTPVRRQIFAKESTTHQKRPHCTPFTLPSNGHIVINPTSTLTIPTNVLFTPECNIPTATGSGSGSGSIHAYSSNEGIITDIREPFHASVIPQAYATGAATVIAWMLVVMLMITPRTFFVGGAGGGFGMLNRHGMISGSQGSASVIGVGSRPWLQKVAALTVAVSLTIATADTFEVAEQQYAQGIMNADQLRTQVVGSTEIKVSRVLSDIFLWLAQVQTLIRLFPRHKEKVLIKWIGFALIILDATFTCLNSFMGNPVGRPRKFRDAIPALSYLFQLALSMLYAAWVLYYATCKRKYAFYHKDMWNVTLVAFLAVIAILTPVVFFITDISNASVAGWGDYFRWVGAAAASVIVWEWVERIEALEREEKKDGILGREVFDGDEMLDSTPSEEVVWPRNRRFWGKKRDHAGNSGGGGGAYTSGQDGMMGGYVSSRILNLRNGDRNSKALNSQSRRLSRVAEVDSDTQLPVGHHHHHTRGIPTPPPAAASPISRTDTASAASTVYTVRYHTVATPTPAVRHNSQYTQQSYQQPQQRQSQPPLPTQPQPQTRRSTNPSHMKEKAILETHSPDLENNRPPPVPTSHSLFAGLTNPFKRKKALPPAEVRSGQVIDPVSIGSSNTRLQPSHKYEPWDLKGRIGAYAANTGERWRERRVRGEGGEKGDGDGGGRVTIIPARRRGNGAGGWWSPDVPPAGEGVPEEHVDGGLADTAPEGSGTLAEEARNSGDDVAGGDDAVQLHFEPSSSSSSTPSEGSSSASPSRIVPSDREVLPP